MMQIPKGRQVQLIVVSLLITISISGLTVYGVFWHRHQAQKKLDRATLDQAAAFREQSNYEGCIDTLGAIAPSSFVYRQAQSALSECQGKMSEAKLAQARQLAKQGSFWSALLVLRSIPLEFADSQEAQHLSYEYSMRIIAVAEEYYLHPSGRFNDAVSVISLLVNDATNPVHGIATEKLRTWQAEWRRNQEHYKLAQIAMEVGDLDAALTEVIQISEHPHWNQHIQGLTQNIEEEQQRHERLWLEAKRAVWQKDDERAVQLAAQLPDVPKWADRKQEILEASEAIHQEREKSSIKNIFVGALLVILEVLLFKFSNKYPNDMA